MCMTISWIRTVSKLVAWQLLLQYRLKSGVNLLIRLLARMQINNLKKKINLILKEKQNDCYIFTFISVTIYLECL